LKIPRSDIVTSGEDGEKLRRPSEASGEEIGGSKGDEAIKRNKERGDS
jgi:hypothetical protein